MYPNWILIRILKSLKFSCKVEEKSSSSRCRYDSLLRVFFLSCLPSFAFKTNKSKTNFIILSTFKESPSCIALYVREIQAELTFNQTHAVTISVYKLKVFKFNVRLSYLQGISLKKNEKKEKKK